MTLENNGVPIFLNKNYMVTVTVQACKGVIQQKLYKVKNKHSANSVVFNANFKKETLCCTTYKY